MFSNSKRKDLKKGTTEGAVRLKRTHCTPALLLKDKTQNPTAVTKPHTPRVEVQRACQPAQLPRAWPRRSQGDHIFRPIYFQLWSLFRPVWQEPSQQLHESSVPVPYCAGQGGCGGGRGHDLRGCWIIYYLWRHRLIWVCAQALGKWFHPPFSP